MKVQEHYERLQTLESENSRLREELRRVASECRRLSNECERYSNLIELAVDAIVSGDTEGRIVDANKSAEYLSGYGKEEMLSHPLTLFFSETEMARVPLRFDLLQRGEVVCSERLLTRKDGEIIPVEMNSKMMPDGTYHTFIRDIRSRKQMEELLRDSEVKQRALADATFEAILIGRDGICIGQNDNAKKMFGYSDAEAVGKPGIQWIAPEMREEVIRNVITEYEKPYETVAVCKDGTPLPVEIQGRTIEYEGGRVRVTAMRDISARKKAEKDRQTLQRLEGVGVLAGGIAHDFNNILTSLFGSISLAKLRLEKDHKALPFLEKAESSISRATHLTQKLLTFSKGGEPVREEVSLAELVYETVSFDLSGSNVKLVFEEVDDLWRADVDRGQIQQVFSNLAINADQAMEDGGHLFITLENFSNEDAVILGLEKGLFVKAVVRDEGAGIAKEHLEYLFDPYFSTKESGRGLGLATVYSIIKKHKGVVDVTSEPGRGTVFTLYLPASRESGQKESGGRQPDTGRHRKQVASVLVMDDDAMIRTVTAEMLTVINCTVETASNGMEAATLYKQAYEAGRPFDLVILDLTVPGGWGGKKTVRKIQDFDPDAKVIVSSGYAEDPVLVDYRNYGFQACITKPYTFDRLYGTINEVLRQ